MTVETTLQEMYDDFPTLFSTKQECFNHLFCTNGNGYCWKWGQIVADVYGLEDMEEIHADDYKNPKIREAKQKEENVKMKQDMDRDIYNCLGDLDIEYGYVDPIKYDPNKHHWYPLCKYALILNIPDDVKTDWKKAANECIEMLKKDGINIEDYKKEKNVRNNLQ